MKIYYDDIQKILEISEFCTTEIRLKSVRGFNKDQLLYYQGILTDDDVIMTNNEGEIIRLTAKGHKTLERMRRRLTNIYSIFPRRPKMTSDDLSDELSDFSLSVNNAKGVKDVLDES